MRAPDDELANARAVITDVLARLGSRHDQWRIESGYRHGFGATMPVIELVGDDGTQLQLWAETENWFWVRWIGPTIGEVSEEWYLRTPARRQRLVDCMVAMARGEFQIAGRELTVSTRPDAMRFVLDSLPNERDR